MECLQVGKRLGREAVFAMQARARVPNRVIGTRLPPIPRRPEARGESDEVSPLDAAHCPTAADGGESRHGGPRLIVQAREVALREGGKLVLAVLVVAGSAACGGGSSPAGPTPVATGAPPPAPAATPTPAPSATPAPAPSATPVPVPSGPTVLRSAAISGANGHAASGTAEIVRDGSRHTLELRSNFRIDSGNNDVYLTRSPNTIASDDLNLGNMRSLTGAQSYDMPNDGGGYRYVMLWCRPFRVPIGVGELR